MKITNVAFFAYAVGDIKKARAFYEGIVEMGPHEYPSCRMVGIAGPDGNRITLHKRNAKSPD